MYVSVKLALSLTCVANRKQKNALYQLTFEHKCAQNYFFNLLIHSEMEKLYRSAYRPAVLQLVQYYCTVTVVFLTTFN